MAGVRGVHGRSGGRGQGLQQCFKEEEVVEEGGGENNGGVLKLWYQFLRSYHNYLLIPLF